MVCFLQGVYSPNSNHCTLTMSPLTQPLQSTIEPVCSNGELLGTLCKKTYENIYRNMGSIVCGEPGNEATMCTW